jgi:hypothetical protein
MDLKNGIVYVRGVVQSLPSGCEWWLVGVRKLGESWLQLLLTCSEPAPLRGASLRSLASSGGSGSFSAAAGKAVAARQQHDVDDDAGPFAAAAAAAAAVTKRHHSLASADEDEGDFMDLDDADAQGASTASGELAGLLQDDDDDDEQQQQRDGGATSAGGVAEQEGHLYPVVSRGVLVKP